MDERSSESLTGRVFWSNNPEENSVAQCSIEERIRRVLITFLGSIIQFWAVKRIAGSKCILTTSHQPFGITGLNKGHCSYRKECMRRNIDVGPEANEVQLGPAGRAFRSRSVEYSPHIHSYTIQEFPLRDHAILCGLRSLVSIPVFELGNNNIVGVLELLCRPYYEYHLSHSLPINLEKVGLKINYNGSSESMDRAGYSEGVAEEIHKMLEEVARTHPLALGLAFTPCRKEYCLNCSGIGCLDKPVAVYRDRHMHSLQSDNVRNGISGRAYASGKSCFCRDIRNFSILEYPLAHHARLAGLTFSVATCLQSIHDENSNVLVLEFLLLPGCYDIKNIKLFTGSLLTKIKELLPHYRIAGEDFPGEELFPQIYDSLNYDEIDHIHGGDSPVSLPVTLTWCNKPDERFLNTKKAVVDFFLPVKLSYETSRKFDDAHALVLWRKDAEKCEEMDERIKLVFKRVTTKPIHVDLVQYWAPRRIAGKSFLTTYDQPFAIRRGIRKVTCLYRIECMRRNISVDEEGNNEEQLGPAGRVFNNGVVESSPDVRLYTINEFPLRDHAVLWNIRNAIFLPVFELDGKATVGVLEILSDYGLELGTYLNDLTKELKKMGLRIDYVHPQPGHSLAEIENIFEAVSVRYPLHFARMLTPSLTDYCHNNSSQGYIGRIWSRRLSKYEVRSCLGACSFHQSLDKNGVAGKALTSRRSCFCINIGNWGIEDYFLSHYVELFGCNFSVAICVENTRLVDTTCVLEFFLLPRDYGSECILGLLDSLLITVKEHLPPNFKILSEEVFGEPFFLEIGKKIVNGSKAIISYEHGSAGGDTNPLVPQENDSDIHIGDHQENISNIHVDGTEATTLIIQGENIYEMHVADGIGENPPVHQEENIYEMHVTDGIEAAPPVHQGENNCSTQRSSSQMEGNKFHITLDQLKLQFGNTLDEAVENLGDTRVVDGAEATTLFIQENGFDIDIADYQENNWALIQENGLDNDIADYQENIWALIQENDFDIDIADYQENNWALNQENGLDNDIADYQENIWALI